MQNTIVYLIGYAGIGKYTIAKELAVLTGAVIVDNQLINSPVFSVVSPDGNAPLPEAVWPKIEGIRRSSWTRLRNWRSRRSAFFSPTSSMRESRWIAAGMRTLHSWRQNARRGWCQ